tara:strand:- start:24 stop:821 length:798 start_codon:yes stop_codon:yes gene_type:complete
VLRLIKISISKLIPRRMQVPVKYWYAHIRGYLEPEMKVLENLISINDRIIDVGANRGIYSYFFSKYSRNIEVFEPNPACSKLLESWSNQLDGIHVHNVALSNKDGLASLLIPVDENGIEHDSSASIENNDFQNTKTQEVSLRRLDEYLFQDITFIKIDVEGHEFSVLQGALNTIAEFKPSMLIEIEQRHNTIEISEIFNFIMNMDYTIFFLNMNKLHELSKFNIKAHQDTDNLNIESKYINNFLCLCNEKLAHGKYASLDHLFDK